MSAARHEIIIRRKVDGGLPRQRSVPRQERYPQKNQCDKVAWSVRNAIEWKRQELSLLSSG